ncbi:MAG TPA: ATP-dependent DNA ligase [Acidimicrobiales bacterium]|nr:ATP-dependent DNA ligase [Acidimicrobiales bacterium]
MDLPIAPPVRPMLAKAVYDVPRGAGLLFEPKWDGFRCVVFRDGDEVVLGSRNDRPLTRYFPELVGALRAALPDRCVVDGEIVVVGSDGLDFEALQQRIHPATSRINRLAEETPASFVAFDLLALGDRDVCDRPFSERRALLEQSMPPDGHPQVRITPITGDPDVAEDWFHRFEGAGFDGVMAKAGDQPYVQDARTMVKVKHQRTADAVVAGFRWHKDGEGIGSLLLGLYDDAGSLNHVGVATSFTAARRRELVAEVEPLREGALEGHPWQAWAQAQAHDGTRLMPGAPSRWNAAKDLSWEPLRPERVAEVRYEHLLGGRFRHASRMVRWRDDKTPAECTYDQLEAVAPAELAAIFGPPD